MENFNFINQNHLKANNVQTELTTEPEIDANFNWFKWIRGKKRADCLSTRSYREWENEREREKERENESNQVRLSRCSWKLSETREFMLEKSVVQGH